MVLRACLRAPLLYNYPPKGKWIVVEIYRDTKRRGLYLALFTDPEGDSCFSIYQISWIKVKKVTFCKLKTSLSRNLIYNLQTFREFFQVHFTILLQIQHENNFLPTYKHRQAKVSRFLGICLYDCFIYGSNFVFRKCLSFETPSWLRSQNGK